MFRLDSQPGEHPDGWPLEAGPDVSTDVDRDDEDRPAGEKLVPAGPRRGFILTVAIMAALVLAAIALLLGG